MKKRLLVALIALDLQAGCNAAVCPSDDEMDQALNVNAPYTIENVSSHGPGIGEGQRPAAVRAR